MSVLLTLSLFAVLLIAALRYFRAQLRFRARSPIRYSSWKIFGLGVIPLFALWPILSSESYLASIFFWATGPAFCFFGIGIARAREKTRERAESVAALYLLRGLIRAGMSLPASLIQMEKGGAHPRFCRALRRSLRVFRQGGNFADCLQRLGSKDRSSAIGRCFRALGSAHKRGLPVGALLDHALPLIELELSTEARLSQLRWGAVAQAVTCALLPWGVLAFWRWMAPVPVSPLGPEILAVLGIEALGVWEIQRAARFE